MKEYSLKTFTKSIHHLLGPTMQTVEQVAEKFPIGAPVRFYPVAGYPEFKETRVRSKPWFGCGHVSIMVEGIAGSVCAEPRFLQLVE